MNTGSLYTGSLYTGSLYTVYLYTVNLSPKFKRVSLNETPEFPFWGLNIRVNFDLRDLKKIENMNNLNKVIFHYKNIDIHKTA